MNPNESEPKAGRRVLLHRLVGLFQWSRISVRRRHKWPRLYVMDRAVSNVGFDPVAEILKRKDSLRIAPGCISVVCGGGIAIVADGSDPMRGVITVINGIRPATGKRGLVLQCEEMAEESKRYNQRLGVRVVQNLTDFIRGGFEWLHGVKQPNDQSSATRPAGRHDCNSDAMAGFAAAH